MTRNSHTNILTFRATIYVVGMLQKANMMSQQSVATALCRKIFDSYTVYRYTVELILTGTEEETIMVRKTLIRCILCSETLLQNVFGQNSS